MKTISKGLFGGTQIQLEARVEAFKTAKQLHASTVGVPAPREEDFIEMLANSEESYQIQPAEETSPLTQKQIDDFALGAKRLQAMDDLLELQLATEASKPGAPQSIKDYVAAKVAKG